MWPRKSKKEGLVFRGGEMTINDHVMDMGVCVTVLGRGDGVEEPRFPTTINK